MTVSADALLRAVGESYNFYLDHGARSTKKLEPFHGYFHDSVESELHRKGIAGVEVRSVRNKEFLAKGALYDKKIDIAVVKKSKCLGGISLKFVVSNYKQNANNYFEHLMGETANLRANGMVYGSMSVIPKNPPYLTKVAGGKRGEVAKVESLSRKDLLKYINLENHAEAPFRPSPLGLLIVDLKAHDVVPADLTGLGLSDAELSTMNVLKDVKRFVDQFVNLIEKAN